jgi:hypothetical protein
MFGRRAWLFVVLLGGLFYGQVRIGSAQDVSGNNNIEARRNRPYTLASVNGEFAVVGTFGANVARQLGVVRINDGQVTGFARANRPGNAPNERALYSFTITGTITVNEDGTGVVSGTATFPDGSTLEFHLDTLITKAKEVHGVKIATEIADMQREASPVVDGQFIVHTLTRRPD